MTARTPAQAEDAAAPHLPGRRPCPARSRWPRALWDARRPARLVDLTRRIVVLNLVGLIALLVGFLYLNQFRAGPDPRPGPEPRDPGRDHRGRDRGLGVGRHRYDPDRSRQAAPAAGRRGRRGGIAAARRSRSTPRRWRRSCRAWSRRPVTAPGSTTRRAASCSTPAPCSSAATRAALIRWSRSPTSPGCSNPRSRRSSRSSAACSAAGPMRPRRRRR